MISFADIDKKNKGEYIKYLTLFAKLSRLFSKKPQPFIEYRIAENIFCKSFKINSLARSNMPFDSIYNDIGIGLKTFACPHNSKFEKIAELGGFAREIKKYETNVLANKLSEFRNERLNFAYEHYNISKSLYHIVARKQNKLILFETDYKPIDVKNINSVKRIETSIQFNDGRNDYSFNIAKNTLFRKFVLPKNAFCFNVEIVNDPYELLYELFENTNFKPISDLAVEGVNYVVLPLYSLKKNEKHIFEKSSLNQWNAGGRKRDKGEIYIPIPSSVHKKFPNFFPARDKKFNLQIPTGETFKAKVCQDRSKALMTEPNNAISDWLLRKKLHLKEGEIATFEKLKLLGIDSVIISKDIANNFQIDIKANDNTK